MSRANPFRIDFPSKPTLVFREEGKVTFIDERGQVASIALTTKDVPPLEAAVIYQRRGMDDVRMFAGPAEQVMAAFADFEIRARTPSTVLADDKPETRPSRPPMVQAAAALGILLGVGLACYGAALAWPERPTPQQGAAKLEMLDRLAKQVEQISGDPNRPASGGIAEAPALMPPGGPLNFKAAKVKQASPDASVSGASQPPAPPAGAIPVPKELPSLPRAEAETHVDLATITDGVPAKSVDTAAPGSTVAIAVGSDPVTPVEASAASSTKIDIATSSKEAAKPEADPKAETKAASGDDKATADAKSTTRIAPSGVAPMSPAEAQELLKTLEQIKSQAAEGGELTPELLKQLPMDVARQLVGTGIATVSAKERTERAQRMARIVRLPATIINQYRGRDGIASIPEQDSWVANAGRISIPLPGGGDVLEPGMLKEFGLNP